MTIGIVIKGRNVTATVGGAKLVGTISKSINFNGEPIDVTDDDALGWQTLGADHGVKSLDISLSGLLKNLELVTLYFGTSQAVEVVWTFPDGGTEITFDAVLSSLSISGDSDVNQTWDASLKSSGAPNYVAAT